MTNGTNAPTHSKSWWMRQTPEKKQQIYENRREYRQNKPTYQNYLEKNRLALWANGHQSTVKNRYPEAFSNSDISKITLTAWLEENETNPCAYCGAASNSIDHKLPLVRGGTHTFDNLQMCCLFCNLSKRDRTHEEFTSWITSVFYHINEGDTK